MAEVVVEDIMEITRGNYLLTDDPTRFDIDAIHALLRSTYWAASRTRQQIAVCMRHSLCVGVFHDSRQIGFASAVTDHGVHTWLCDVVVHPDHRNRGLGRWMPDWLLKHPSVAPTRVLLVTKDAQKLYRECGFQAHPYECMIRYPDAANEPGQL